MPAVIQLRVSIVQGELRMRCPSAGGGGLVARPVEVLLAVLLWAVAVPSLADDADLFFDDSAVRDIAIFFDDPEWYDTLLAGHADNPDDPYFPARFEYGDLVLDPVGVRFKGNSSFRIPGVKKPFRIDFNEYDEGDPGRQTTFYGMKKLNLNNGFKDPTLLREKLFLDFCSPYLPSLRAVHVRVWVNGEYWGLYTAVEHIDELFIARHFGAGEDGNLFEGEGSGASPGGAFGSDLRYHGPDPEPYYELYQLKTNLDANDWSGLIELTDVLNNTPTAQLPGRLDGIFDVKLWLRALATNILFVNLDSYPGSAHNYYLYDRDDTGRMTYLHWDVNEAFGTFRFGVAPGQDMRELDPLWLPEAGPGGTPQPRPLMSQVWSVEAYRRSYLRLLARMLREGFDRHSMEQRITERADLIRSSVYSDPHKPYSNQDFETALRFDLVLGQERSHGLLDFVTRRAAFLDETLDGFAEAQDIRLNELLSINVSSVVDDAGDHDPWLEVYNLGPGQVECADLYLTDDSAQPLQWRLPQHSLDDGGFLVLWLDAEPHEGSQHAPFRLDPDGGQLFLVTASDPSVPIDRVSYPALGGDRAWARSLDGEGPWLVSDQPTFAAPNLPSTTPPALVINELMAENHSTIADPSGSGYPDWLELYNAGEYPLDLEGMYLTDDRDDPTKWRIPEGVVVGPGAFLLIWADNDCEQGPTHAGFKLDADGEDLALYDSDAAGRRLIDVVSFPEQHPDVSYGREVDGGETFVFLARPSPGRPNAVAPRRGPAGRVGPG
jgi:spore coat protein CotH